MKQHRECQINNSRATRMADFPPKETHNQYYLENYSKTHVSCFLLFYHFLKDISVPVLIFVIFPAVFPLELYR